MFRELDIYVTGFYVRKKVSGLRVHASLSYRLRKRYIADVSTISRFAGYVVAIPSMGKIYRRFGLCVTAPPSPHLSYP